MILLLCESGFNAGKLTVWKENSQFSIQDNVFLYNFLKLINQCVNIVFKCIHDFFLDILTP